MVFYAKTSGRSALESINYNIHRWFVTIIQHGSSVTLDAPHNVKRSHADSKRTIKIRVLVYLSLALLIIAVLAPLGFQTDQLNLYHF